MPSVIPPILGAIAGLFLLAAVVALVARKLRLFRMEKVTVQMRAIPDPGPASRAASPGNRATAAVGPHLRETSVPDWASRVIVLTKPVVTIGRSLDSDVVLPEDSVSAEHCRLERQGHSFRLIDLASTNKTWVNGHEVENVVLGDGDQIRVGHTTFVFEWSGDRG